MDIKRMHVWKYICQLDRVVDGDTLDAEIDLGFGVYVKKRIRLADMDAWESRTRDLQEKEKGLAAKQRLIDLIEESNNKFWLISFEQGKYGRVIGAVILQDGRSVNDILVEEGHGYSYDGGSREKARIAALKILKG